MFAKKDRQSLPFFGERAGETDRCFLFFSSKLPALPVISSLMQVFRQKVGFYFLPNHLAGFYFLTNPF
jgi:hypothetical protein